MIKRLNGPRAKRQSATQDPKGRQPKPRGTTGMEKPNQKDQNISKLENQTKRPQLKKKKPNPTETKGNWRPERSKFQRRGASCFILHLYVVQFFGEEG